MENFCQEFIMFYYFTKNSHKNLVMSYFHTKKGKFPSKVLNKIISFLNFQLCQFQLVLQLCNSICIMFCNFTKLQTLSKKCNHIFQLKNIYQKFIMIYYFTKNSQNNLVMSYSHKKGKFPSKVLNEIISFLNLHLLQF